MAASQRINWGRKKCATAQKNTTNTIIIIVIFIIIAVVAIVVFVIIIVVNILGVEFCDKILGSSNLTFQKTLRTGAGAQFAGAQFNGAQFSRGLICRGPFFLEPDIVGWAVPDCLITN